MKVPEPLRQHYPQLEQIARRNAGRTHTISHGFTAGKEKEGFYFLKRFSKACRASSGREGVGASAGTWAGCM